VLSGDELGVLTASFNAALDELRDSRARVVSAADAARRQVERDLHDGAQQQLVLMRLRLGALQRHAAGGDDVGPLVAELRADLERALAQLRDLAHGLYPVELESGGLRGALEESARRSPIPVFVDGDSAGRYAPHVEAAIYFCCLEALQNAAKYAGDGARATVTLDAHNGTLAFEVRDDGRGFDPAATPPSAGLQNMRDRVGALGGALDVVSAPGAGTRVAGRLPVR
jgi:signal transduction histidine kinase